jgi:type II restriction enzyme
MKRNVIWATGSYAALGEYYRDSGQITPIALQRMGKDSIQPRILKAQEEQQQRTRKHGEVQTPAWLCCRMNDYLDETWFERENVFNVQDGQTWVPVEGKIIFPKHRHSSWRQYIDSRRLEITCGEAPFIVSRYDAATGEAIPIERRIGLLDRKLRIVSENTDSEAEWVKWAIRAIGSVYGYEYQGDNLLIARINVLMTFVEYLQSMWHRGPTEKELTTVANIISWNFWQMDGLTGTVPKGKLQAPEARPITMEELGWFAAIDGATSSERSQEQETTPPCRICNWRQAHTVTFILLKTHRGRDVRNMKFDYAIGNPPYQEDVQNKGDRANPVYDKL